MTTKATIVYIPHGGGPLPLLDEAGHLGMNSFLRGFASTIEKPDAIIVISAHWEEDEVAVTSVAKPSLLFDYYGFPAKAYQYQYPALGEPELAARVQRLLQLGSIDSKLDPRRGLDHGVFVPLILMYPDSDIPCIQVSLSRSLDADLHIRIGEALTELKTENLLIIGSGFSFHNMQAFMAKTGDGMDEKNQAFEEWLAQTCSDTALAEHDRRDRLVNWHKAPHAKYCHPREEHLLPLQVCYGIGQTAASTVFQESVSGFLVSAYQW